MTLPLVLHQLLDQLSFVPRELAPAASSCNDRTIYGIIWSCLTTIFACTWISVHPNVTKPDERPILRRLKIFVLALIAPELIVLWAVRQWVSSRKLAHRYKEYGWTQAHGFFAIMGAFQVCRPNDSNKFFVLDPDDIEPYLKNHDITISKEEIQDRSKGDVLTKSLVILQVTWFILQIVVRTVQHLAITELEVVTLAFAILNFIIYFCWWNKPLDVNCRLKVTAYHESAQQDSQIMQDASSPILLSMTLAFPTSSDDLDSSTLASRFNVTYYQPESTMIQGLVADQATSLSLDTINEEQLESANSVDTNHSCSSLHLTQAVQPLEAPSHFSSSQINVNHPLPQVNPSPILLPQPATLSTRCKLLQNDLGISQEGHLSKSVNNTLTHHSIWSAFMIKYTKCIIFMQHNLLIFQQAFSMFFHTIVHFLTAEFSKLVVRGGSVHTYAFGTLTKKENTIVDSLACGIAVIFGAIHCIAWNFKFPSKSEAILWHASSLIVACLPVYAIILPYIQNFLLNSVQLRQQWPQTRRWLVLKLYIPSVQISKLLYMSARLLLLVQMFVLLRTPSAGVYTPINWVTYIPHL